MPTTGVPTAALKCTGPESYEINKRILLNGEKIKPDSCWHAFLKYRNKLIDCRREISETEHDHMLNVNESFLIESINRKKCWNSSFNRKYVKQIEENLDIDLSDVKV